MTEARYAVAGTVPVAFLAVVVGHHPAVALPLLCGAFLPDIDLLSERTHRSWACHTFLLPAVAYVVGDRLGLLARVPALTTAIHFVTLGVAVHLALDFGYPRRRTHDGTSWPVRPAVPASHWGLLWLGAAWAFQWFLYLVPAFFPWVAGV